MIFKNILITQNKFYKSISVFTPENLISEAKNKYVICIALTNEMGQNKGNFEKA